jgi:hypothetical protein
MSIIVGCTAESTAVAVVLEYAARNWQVFQLRQRSKAPATGRGFYDATANPAVLRRRFGGRHPFNIGIRTGVASGVFVLDVDGDSGRASLARLVDEHGPLPLTRTSSTARGRHYWFTCPNELPSSTGRLGEGIDIKADGGYVVAPPSVHPDGPAYAWLNDADPVDPPEWVLTLARHKPPREAGRLVTAGPLTCTDAYCRAALRYESLAVATAIKGGRNHRLNRASFCLHQLVAIGKLTADDVTSYLLDACRTCGLLADDGERQCLATIKSGAKAGLENPRRVP